MTARDLLRRWVMPLFAGLMLGGCATSSTLHLRPGAGSPDTIALQPLQNLAGVSLRVPELYVGDMLGSGAPIEVDLIDLRLVSEAALLGALRGGQYQLAENARFRLYAAITEYEATTLRKSGRYKMGLLLMLVDVASNTEVARGGAVREFQLFETGPEERGVLGHERFVRRRLEGFTEMLALEALADLGLR